MKQAVMYGGGNIGRGFIGALFSQSDFEVTFIDVADPVVQALCQRHSYPVRYVSDQGHEDVLIEHVSAINGNDQEAVAQAIAACDIMATAVGVRILDFIIPNLVAGLRMRWSRTQAPLNLIICENLMDADKYLRQRIKAQLTEEERVLFDQRVGLVEASIGRMVPVQTEEMKDGDPLRVCVEQYGFLPVDQAAFKGEIPRIQNMIPFSPFDFYLKRKLYIHNMGHAVCAYLGDYLGLPYIYQAIDTADIRIIVQNAMEESALALSGKYKVKLNDLQLHIANLLYRFTNSALMDTCQRVGGDPSRKLSPSDRLIGSSLLALEQGITPAYIAMGAAAGLRRYLLETGAGGQRSDTAGETEFAIPGGGTAEEVESRKQAGAVTGKPEGGGQKAETAEKALLQISGLLPDSPLALMILDFYGMLLEKKTLLQLRKRADWYKSVELRNVI